MSTAGPPRRMLRLAVEGSRRNVRHLRRRGTSLCL